MSFLHPEFLYFMLPPLFILFGLLLTQKETQAHFFSEEVMRKLRVSANTLTLRARNALFFLMGFLMIIALAQPVINDGVIQVKAKSSDIMIALDISDSMLAEDVYPNRLKLAKKKALELLKMAPNERIGVIAFAKNSYLVSPLSFDHSAVAFLLSSLSTDSITEKGTDFLSMLDVVSNSVKKESKKYLLILSDGGDESDFSKEIAYAKEKGIVVFVLGIGTQKGAPIKKEDGTFIKYKGDIIVSKLNDSIADLATKSGGSYIENVIADDDVKAMLGEIENKGDKKELKSEDVQRYTPLFYYPLGVAMFILMIATSSMTKRETMQVPSAFILFALLFATPHAEAGLLDFMELKEAKEAYTNKEYEKASELYEKSANASKNGESFYNAGNAYYKQKKYDEAIQSYEKATFDDKTKRAENFANMGNAYVKQNKEGSLEKAKKAYEESLKLREDKEVRENLQEVEKYLKKQQQENQKENQDTKDSQNQEKQEQDKQEQNQNSNDNKDSKDGENKEQEQKENQQENQQNSDEKKDSKDSKGKEKKSEEQKENSQDENSKPNDEKKESEKQSAQEQKKEDLKELEKQQPTQGVSQESMQQAKMSDAEEKKWLNELNENKNTYMYMLGKQKANEDSFNEKPW